jgi:hypothetical protein
VTRRISVSAVYKGYPRVLSPHILGTKKDVEFALCYQTGGESSQGAVIPNSPDNWRCMKVVELEGLALSDEPWGSVRGTSRKTSSCVDFVDVEVDPSDLG